MVKSTTNYKLVKFITKLEIGQIRNQLLIGQLYEFSNELYMSLCHNRPKHIYKLFTSVRENFGFTPMCENKPLAFGLIIAALN